MRESFATQRRLQIAVAGLALLAIFLLLLDIFDLSLFRGRPNVQVFGDVGTWFTGIATAGAVGVALFETLSQKRRLDAGELRERTSVHVRLSIDSDTWTLRLDNFSGAPIQTWVARSETVEELHLCSSCAGPLAAGLDISLCDENWVRVLPSPTPSNWFDVEIAFVAIDGSAWLRKSSDEIGRCSTNDIASRTCRFGGREIVE